MAILSRIDPAAGGAARRHRCLVKKLIELNEWQIEKLPLDDPIISGSTIQELKKASGEAMNRLICGIEKRYRKLIESDAVMKDLEKWSEWKLLSEARFLDLRLQNTGYSAFFLHNHYDAFIVQYSIRHKKTYFCQSVIAPIKNPWFMVDGSVFMQIANYEELNLPNQRFPGATISESLAGAIAYSAKGEPFPDAQLPMHDLILQNI